MVLGAPDEFAGPGGLGGVDDELIRIRHGVPREMACSAAWAGGQAGRIQRDAEKASGRQAFQWHCTESTAIDLPLGNSVSLTSQTLAELGTRLATINKVFE